MSFPALADSVCEDVKIIEKSTYERPNEFGLLKASSGQEELIKAHGLTQENGKQIRVFVSDEHSYGGGSYIIKSATHKNNSISVELEFVADLFSVGTAATNHRLLFFIIDKRCGLSEVYINVG